MTDLERERIRAEATAAADDANWKKSVNDRIATIEKMHGYGVKAIIQPGGSIRDEEVIEACDEHGIAMVFTGHRHFRH